LDGLFAKILKFVRPKDEEGFDVPIFWNIAVAAGVVGCPCWRGRTERDRNVFQVTRVVEPVDGTTAVNK